MGDEMMIDTNERREKWFQSALEQELQAIERLPPDLNIHKPNNLFWQSLFRIAGVVKAGYISKDDAYSKIQTACQHMNLIEKNMIYQWNRAYKRAAARFPNI